MPDDAQIAEQICAGNRQQNSRVHYYRAQLYDIEARKHLRAFLCNLGKSAASHFCSVRARFQFRKPV